MRVASNFPDMFSLIQAEKPSRQNLPPPQTKPKKKEAKDCLVLSEL